MKKVSAIVIFILVLALGFGGYFYITKLRTGPPGNRLNRTITTQMPTVGGNPPNQPARNNTDFPLTLPDGFSISTFASGISDARVMEFDSENNLWVSQPAEGAVSRIDVSSGSAGDKTVVFRGLKNPHGLAFDPDDSNALYIAEENRISKANINSSDKTLQKIIDLPVGGNHITRTLLFGRDGRLYVSIGSSCNACEEGDSRRAKIFSMNKDGSDFREFARGLRNTVFFARSPFDGKLWGNDMGRDLLGDDIPPDEINILEEGKDYGWPFCYGKNIHDDSFDPQKKVSCDSKTSSYVDIPAHSAPLGLAFVPEGSSWPTSYKGSLIVAFHGSWNRSTPTGYKLVRAKLDSGGNFSGFEDFITGWIEDNGTVHGRPVDVKFKNNVLYVSDDKAGMIYKILY